MSASSPTASRVLSVRLPEQLLLQTQALAAVMGSSPNAVVVDALREHIQTTVGSTAYLAARDAQRQRLAESEALLEAAATN